MNATVVQEPEVESEPTLRYRFRKAWRAVFFLALIPFFAPTMFSALIGINEANVRFFSGVLVLVPLSTFLEVVTEDLIERLGQFAGGLLHAAFGNAAYFVLTVTTLIAASTAGPEKQQELVTVVQSSIAGSIVIDILFILGISIFIGGLRNGRMQFSAEYSNQYAEMLLVAIIALALPSLAYRLHISVGFQNANAFNISATEAAQLSDVTAVILIIAYIGYLGWTIFHFRDKAARPQNPAKVDAALVGDEYGVLAAQIAPVESEEQRQQLLAERTQPKPGKSAQDLVNERLEEQRHAPLTASQRQTRKRSRRIAWWELAILIAGTAGVVFISENMAEGLRDGLVNGFGLNVFFVGFIALPVASNLVELSAAINTAWHDRLETCLAVTAGSAIQVALLVAPALVLVGHIVGLSQMNLLFGPFILVIFGLIAYLFQIITMDGETTWLEGLQLTSFFAVIIVVALFATP